MTERIVRMEQKEFKIKGYKYIFRVAKLNAIEVLALQTQVSFDDIDKTAAMFNTILERIEVKCDEQWLRCKEKYENVYYPAELETDVVMVKRLVEAFMNDYLKPIFWSSDELK